MKFASLASVILCSFAGLTYAQPFTYLSHSFSSSSAGSSTFSRNENAQSAWATVNTSGSFNSIFGGSFNSADGNYTGSYRLNVGDGFNRAMVRGYQTWTDGGRSTSFRVNNGNWVNFGGYFFRPQNFFFNYGNPILAAYNQSSVDLRVQGQDTSTGAGSSNGQVTGHLEATAAPMLSATYGSASLSLLEGAELNSTNASFTFGLANIVGSRGLAAFASGEQAASSYADRLEVVGEVRVNGQLVSTVAGTLDWAAQSALGSQTINNLAGSHTLDLSGFSVGQTLDVSFSGSIRHVAFGINGVNLGSSLLGSFSTSRQVVVGMAPVPEPFTMVLGGAAAAAFIRKRRRAKSA